MKLSLIAILTLGLGLISGFSIGRNAEAQDHKAYINDIINGAK